MTTKTKPRLAAQFLPLSFGQIGCTPGAMAALEMDSRRAIAMLDKCRSGDWGKCCPEDWATNDAAAVSGDRIIASYPIDATKECKGYGENCIWIIVYPGRETTVLLPDEY